MLETHISKAHEDRSNVPELCRSLMAGDVLVIGQWADAGATQLMIQDFNLDGRTFIPLFSDSEQFWTQMGSTPFVNQGLTIECRALIRILQGDELLVLNPGTATSVQLCREDFEPFLNATDPETEVDPQAPQV